MIRSTSAFAVIVLALPLLALSACGGGSETTPAPD